MKNILWKTTLSMAFITPIILSFAFAQGGTSTKVGTSTKETSTKHAIVKSKSKKNNWHKGTSTKATTTRASSTHF